MQYRRPKQTAAELGRGRGCRMATPDLTAFALIGGLIVLGLLVGAGLVVLSWFREREHLDVIAEVTPAAIRRDRAA